MARRHVYVFFVNGVDPVNLANLTGVRDYVQALGFSQTYYGQLYHTLWFAAELRRIRAADPDSRFVLVGFSLGSQMVHALAQSARKANADIDLIAYLSGNTPLPLPANHPDNVGRVIVINPGSGAGPTAPPGAGEEYQLTAASHFATPADPQTLQILGEALLAIASNVSISMPTPPPEPADPEMAPTPRPVRQEEQESGLGSEWDFLKPQAIVSPVPILE